MSHPANLIKTCVFTVTASIGASLLTTQSMAAALMMAAGSLVAYLAFCLWNRHNDPLKTYSVIVGSISVTVAGLLSLLVPGTVWSLLTWGAATLVFCTCGGLLADRFVD